MRARELVRLDSIVFGNDLEDPSNPKLVARVREDVDPATINTMGGGTNGGGPTSEGTSGGSFIEGGHDFVELLRVVEPVTPAPYDFGYTPVPPGVSPTLPPTVTFAPTPTIRIDNVMVNEDAGFATFTVNLSAPSGEPVLFSFLTTDGTARSGLDYTGVGGSGQIPPGQTSVTISVPIADDFFNEGNENFTVSLGDLSSNVDASGSTLTGSGTITDAGSPGGEGGPIPGEESPVEVPGASDKVYAVLAGPPTVSEGDTTATYQVQLVDWQGNPVTVGIATTITVQFTSGSAEAGDYDATERVLTIQPGSSSTTFTVATSEDFDFDDETYVASIRSVQDTGEFEAIDFTTGVPGHPASVQTTILDDDTRPTLAVNDVTVNEDAGTATFTVTLSGPTLQAVAFDYATANGSATADADYASTSGSATIAAGQTSVTITVPISDDFLKEGNETFTVSLSGLSSNVDAAGSDLQGIGTITDAGSSPAGNPPPETVGAPDKVFAIIEGPPEVNEGETTTAYTVRLVDSNGNPVTVTQATQVTVQFTNGTAEAGDYAAADQVLTIAAGSSSTTFTVATAQDADFADDTYTASIKSVQDTGEFEGIDITSGAGGQQPRVTTTILDDDTGPTIAINDVVVNEDAGTATFTVTLSAPLDSAVTFDYSTSNGTATAGADYTAAAGSGTIAAGATSVTVTVAIRDDFLKEGDETFTVNLSNLSPTVVPEGSDLQGVGTIRDAGSPPGTNPPPETIGAGDKVYAVLSGPLQVTEGDVTAPYTVRLVDINGNPVVVTQATKVTINFTSGTAESGDYASADKVVTIAAGSSTATFTVATNQDGDFDDETYTASIKSVQDTGQFEGIDITSGAGGRQPHVLTTIDDNDVRPSISVNDITIDEAAGTATFTVTLSAPTMGAVNFSWATSNGTAVAGDDYGAASGTGTIAAGATTTTITVAITDDLLDENNETFTVNLSGLSANVAPSGNDLSGRATITDDDATPELSISDITVNEAAGTATFTVTLSAESGRTVTVDYATALGSTEGGDHDLPSGTLTFAPGQTTQTVTVTITNDDVFENLEDYTVTLDNAVNATIADGTGDGGIIDDGTGGGGDDDDRPSLSVSSESVTEGSDDFAVFTVSLSNASAFDTTVSLSLASGSASVGTDTGASLEVSTDGGSTWATASSATIAAGSTSVLVRTAITDDALDEPAEAFTLTATRTAGTTTNASDTGAGTITDDDAPPALSISDITVNEGAGTATFVVTLSAESGRTVTVDYSTA
ncbi:MAG: hypothetical protein HY854_21910, partial [Burkholderiales bacterium]|nr:hypothetical protein [Burkholderiales bacterium]